MPTPAHTIRRRTGFGLASLMMFALAACGGSPEESTNTTSPETSDGTLVIYSGRNEELVGGLLKGLEAQVGAPVEIRYGDSSELAATLLEEGEATEADLFFSQDAGALGALAKAGRLAPLDDSVTSAVEERFVDSEGRWVATSARARVVAYNPAQVPEIAQITTIDDLLDPAYKGKIGYAPTNASFHAFVTALRVQRGEDGALDWLTKFKAQEPQSYERNGAVLTAVDSGEVALGLINHYYWYEKVGEEGADNVTAKIHYLAPDDPGALVNVAGAGVLAGSDQEEAATKAIGYLLSTEGQTYFAEETSEYPVIDGVETGDHELPALAATSAIDLNDLDSLDQTLAMLDQVGLT